MKDPRLVIVAVLLASLGCAHSDTFATSTPESNGPFAAGTDVQLSFNGDQDYWPMWTQDGRGILYAYVDPANPKHRCIGLIPAPGGTRTWQLCDNRAVRIDTMSSYGAFALDTAGRLLATEAVSGTHEGVNALPHTKLWIADTAHPYVRTTLLEFPVTVGTIPVTWLADLAWTGPNTFIALGQQFNTVPHCVSAILPGGGITDTATLCNSRDTLWVDAGGTVLRGTIDAGHATLQPIPGTENATSYSLAENGASIVFTIKHQVQLFKVPAAGGTPEPAPAPLPSTSVEYVGVSCKGSTCVYARDSVGLTTYGRFFFTPFNAVLRTPPYTFAVGNMELHTMSLMTGADHIVAANNVHDLYATPQISPVSGDVVVQVGAGWGHLVTFATRSLPALWDRDGNSTLRLFKDVAP